MGIENVPYEKFQSTLPAWGETILQSSFVERMHISIHSPRMGRDKGVLEMGDTVEISIHSPRMGRDIVDKNYWNKFNNFNPLSPHGERLYS